MIYGFHTYLSLNSPSTVPLLECSIQKLSESIWHAVQVSYIAVPQLCLSPQTVPTGIIQNPLRIMENPYSIPYGFHTHLSVNSSFPESCRGNHQAESIGTQNPYAIPYGVHTYLFLNSLAPGGSIGNHAASGIMQHSWGIRTHMAFHNDSTQIPQSILPLPEGSIMQNL